MPIPIPAASILTFVADERRLTPKSLSRQGLWNSLNAHTVTARQLNEHAKPPTLQRWCNAVERKRWPVDVSSAGVLAASTNMGDPQSQADVVVQVLVTSDY